MAGALALLAERDPALRKLIRTIAERDGHAVDAVASARTALQRLSTRQYDCLILGSPLVLGRQNRRTLLEHLEEEATAIVPRLIVLTARTLDRDILRRAARLRVCAVISEPFEIDELLAAIRACSRNARPKRRFIGFGEPTLRHVFGDDLSLTEW